MQILKELKEVNSRLDVVKNQVAEVSGAKQKIKKNGQKLSTASKLVL